MLPRILFLDIETAPILAWVWGLFKPLIAICQIEQDWHMLCYAAKWKGEDCMLTDANWFHKRDFKKDRTNDFNIVSSLWHLLDEADIVVAHNGDKFDVSKINAKFFEYGFTPPSPYKIVDTLKVAKNRFNFSSNRLDYISRLRQIGQKLKTDFELWKDVMDGVPSECDRMMEYNEEDVYLLEEVYEDMLPWISNHPNVGVYSEGDRACCTNCGSDNIHYRGTAKTQAGSYRRFVCKECGTWGRDALNLLPISVRKSLGRNIPK